MTLTRVRMSNNITQTISWESEPNGRGTFSTLSSCIITLTLCVWVAVHLNVPEEHTSVIQRYETTLYWVLMGVLAPELVVYLAWTQWFTAKALTAQIRGILLEENVSGTLINSADYVFDKFGRFLAKVMWIKANPSI